MQGLFLTIIGLSKTKLYDFQGCFITENRKKIIMDKNKSIEALQFFTTGLTNGAFVHKVQGQILKSAGYTKLGENTSTTTMKKWDG